MRLKPVIPTAWVLALGNANAVLLLHGDELTLFDAGFPGKEQIVLDAISELGGRPADLKHIVFTHSHPDHIGSAAALVRATGARTYMSAIDAPIAQGGGPFRPLTPAPGLLQRAIFGMVWKPDHRVPPVQVDQHVADGEMLPIAGGLQAIHVPGHAAGQFAYLCHNGMLLIAGDAFINIIGLADPIGFEDAAEGRRSQQKLAALQFDRAVFGHGRPILADASERLRRALR